LTSHRGDLDKRVALWAEWKSSKMKVSVVVATYNRPYYLYKVLKGLLGQTVLPDEVIIADDGSTNDTRELIEEIKKNSKIPIIHIWQEDKGFRKSLIMNKAIAQSRGEYIICCDDDSIPSKEFVEDHIKYSEKGCFVQGHRVLLGKKVSLIFENPNPSLCYLVKLGIKGEAKNIHNAFRLFVPLIKKSHELKGIRGCNLSFFKKDFIAVNGYNEDFQGWGMEDSELAVRFYKYGLKRKDLRFRACVFHLYHPPYDRTHLQKNIKLLEESIKKQEYFCKNGINKYL
jgi:glycosyltransferase involved in cell wall biosynthesis